MQEPLPITEENLAMLYEQRRAKPAKPFRKCYNMGHGLGWGVFAENRYDPLKGYKRDTYSDHLDLYYENKNKLDFDPHEYKKWDRIIQDYLDDLPGNGAVYNPQHKFYEHYEPLRQNIALLRLVLYNEFFPDGEFTPNDPHDVKRAQIIEEMAKHVAGMLKRRAFWSNVVNAIFPIGIKNRAMKRFGVFGTEHIGAAELYRKLQKKDGTITLNPLNWIKGEFSYKWNLPPIEETPFSYEDMALAQYIEKREDELGMEDPGAYLSAEAFLLQRSAAALNNPQDMPVGDVKQSVELGHKILDNLKKLRTKSADELLNMREQQRKELEESQLLVELANAYQEVISGLAHSNPQSLQLSVFEDARLAIGKLGHITLIAAMNAYQKENSMEATHKLQELLDAKDNLPAEFQEIDADTKEELIATIAQALYKAAELQNINQKRNVSEEQNIDRSVNLSPEQQHKIRTMQLTMQGEAARISAASANLVEEARAINAANQQKTRRSSLSLTSLSHSNASAAAGDVAAEYTKQPPPSVYHTQHI